MRRVHTALTSTPVVLGAPVLGASLAFAQPDLTTVKTAIPAGAANCALAAAPANAGAYVTPGGFILVHPRNAALTDTYTGCKTLWVVDAPDRIHRLMTLYFEGGKLRVALAYDGRGGTEARAACTPPWSSPGCEEVESNPLAALRLPTYPRACIDDPDNAECAKDPQ